MPTAGTARQLSYKMGTNNAGTLFKGAKKVPKGTLFFIGANGQLYMRIRPLSRGRRQIQVRGELSGNCCNEQAVIVREGGSSRNGRDDVIGGYSPVRADCRDAPPSRETGHRLEA